MPEERRKARRTHTAITALVRPRRRRKPVVLRVINLGPGGARCRTSAGLRVGATMPVEFVLEGRGVGRHPHVLRTWCRVAWTACRLGPSRPVQEVGLTFLDLTEDDRRLLAFLLNATAAA